MDQASSKGRLGEPSKQQEEDDCVRQAVKGGLMGQTNRNKSSECTTHASIKIHSGIDMRTGILEGPKHSNGQG